MKRKLFSLIAIVMVAAMVLSACGTPAAETPPVEEGGVDWSTVTPAQNITFWHQHTGEDREAAMEKIEGLQLQMMAFEG